MPAYYLETIVVSIGLLMLLIEAFAPVGDKRSIAWLGVLGIIVVLCLLFKIEPHVAATDGGKEHPFWSFYSDDGLALFFKGLTLICTLVVLLMSVDFAPTLKRYLAPGEKGASKDAGVGEFYALPIFVCAGLMWMASATHLVSIFVALETVTIGFYVLVAYMRRNIASLEAGVKYLILGALSTGFLVYGFTWLYGITGEFELSKIGIALASEETSAGSGPQLFAFALILIALGFKVGAVPFQLWIPDVYQGAPTPVSAFLSVGSKAAGFVVLIRIAQVFLESGAIAGQTLSIFVVIAGATLIFGNLAALPQTNFKRLLAYSSISHAGFLLMALTAGVKYRESSTTAIAFYLAAYLAMTLLAFLVMVAVRNHSDSDELSAYNGLGKRSPFLAFTLTVAMASLAGVPLTAGFFGKFFVFQVAIQDRHYVLLAIAIVAAAAGFYYYFKVIRAMYWEHPNAAATDSSSTAEMSAPRLSSAARFTAVVLMIAVIVFGFYPQGILNLLN
jgi:NADH-quinone oxidoreductase subunit N